MVQAIFGLGNPGLEYKNTRHNAGFWYVDAVAAHFKCVFKKEKKFKAEVAHFSFNDQKVWLVKPQTFMNNSGRSVSAFLQFYKIPVDELLVAYDELDLPAGVIKLKRSGGHGGHNGLRDIIPGCGKDFTRLRIGIGHPGDKSKVTPWVLGRPNTSDEQLIFDSINKAISVTEEIVQQEIAKAMLLLHTKN